MSAIVKSGVNVKIVSSTNKGKTEVDITAEVLLSIVDRDVLNTESLIKRAY